MGDYSRIGDGVASAFIMLAALCVVFIPLGLWKLVELLILLFSHLHWN